MNNSTRVEDQTEDIDSTEEGLDERFQRIWQAVAAIPAGRVMSYGQVAMVAGMPRRARFVSRALRAAPDDLELPWHRVIRSDGSIAFEPGSSSFRKQVQHLRAEGVSVTAGKVQAEARFDGDDLDFSLWSME